MAHEAEYETVFHCERQADGWPRGLTKEEKATLTEAVRRILNDNPGGLNRDQIYRLLKNDPEGYQPLRRASLYSYIYCTIDRACRAADATQVYTLNAPDW